MQAVIYKSTGSWYLVKTKDGKRFNGRLKGSFRNENITSTNPLAVGDIVHIEHDTGSEQSVIITDIATRKNYMARSSPHNKHQHHIVAANLDQAILFATLKTPKTSNGFIDRFLVSAEAFHVPTIIVFNKIDVYKQKEVEQLELFTDLYTSIGYEVMRISLFSQEGLTELRQLLQHKTSLISGHSGVGKSTFINTIIPDKTIKTQEVSGWSGKGMHTTTFAEMYDLPLGGRVIDTPGIREFGLTDITKNELSHYFPEMRKQLQNCRFNNCLHINEPDCAIKKSVYEQGTVSPTRYISYLNILESI